MNSIRNDNVIHIGHSPGQQTKPPLWVCICVCVLMTRAPGCPMEYIVASHAFLNVHHAVMSRVRVSGCVFVRDERAMFVMLGRWVDEWCGDYVRVLERDTFDDNDIVACSFDTCTNTQIPTVLLCIRLTIVLVYGKYGSWCVLSPVSVTLRCASVCYARCLCCVFSIVIRMGDAQTNNDTGEGFTNHQSEMKHNVLKRFGKLVVHVVFHKVNLTQTN